MKVLNGPEISPGSASHKIFKRGAAVTIGNFDGVHLGHREIIARLRNKASELSIPTVVMTFDPHPRKVLSSSPENINLILDFRTKCRIFESLGIDVVVKEEFSREFASQSPREFIDRRLMRLNPRAIVVGYDFNFGRGGAGSVEMLEEEGRKRNFTVETVEAFHADGVIVSSSRIRNLIEGGEVAMAEKLLGRPYSVFGHVIKGHGRGRRLGFPTANIDISTVLLPCDGVYAGEVIVKNRDLHAMVNIGTNPTFGDIARTLEACILHFHEDIYGIEVEVRFRERIRSEKKFSGPEQLIEQIKHDQRAIERFFQTHGTSGKPGGSSSCAAS